jgi:4-hydroxy-L-threonine phosphate dehydrogenase PdxA
MALATVHIPLREVSAAISQELIFERLTSLNDTLNKDFLLKKGKIAVLALNPHGGDGGVIGNEDDAVVSPAIKNAFDQGIMAFGPFPADSFFGSGKYLDFDAVLAMYHDQGLIPFKTLAFGKGVNFSSGLDIIRTSPDHGSGFDIAGKGVANESSFRQALYLAVDLVKNRSLSKAISSNPLKIKKSKKEY